MQLYIHVLIVKCNMHIMNSQQDLTKKRSSTDALKILASSLYEALNKEIRMKQRGLLVILINVCNIKKDDFLRTDF